MKPTWTSLVLGLATLFGLVWAPAAQADWGTLNQSTAVGLKFSSDFRWPMAGGYRPVRITVTPTRPVVANRTLVVEIFFKRSQGRIGKDLRVIQEIEIPAGSGPVETTISVPQLGQVAACEITVVENEKPIPRFNAIMLNPRWYSPGLEEEFPNLLIVGNGGPMDTGGIGALLGADQYDEYFPVISRPLSTSNASAPKFLLPGVASRTAAELPRRWIDYSSLDLVFLSIDELASMARKHKEATEAILQWTRAGGNLCVFGVQPSFARLAELELLLGIPAQAEGAASTDQEGGGWQLPEEKAFKRPIKGVRDRDRDPASARLVWQSMGQAQSAKQLQPSGQPQPSLPLLGMGPDMSIRPTDPEEPFFREGEAPFLTHGFGMGMVVALAKDPFEGVTRKASSADGGSLLDVIDPSPQASSPDFYFWNGLLNSIGARRFLWRQRHGVSMSDGNDDFWNFLIPGIGLTPVISFLVFITLFVLGIGPLNYFLLLRLKRLHLLVVTVPVSATAITLFLFAYAILADGLGTRVRVRSITRLDQSAGQAVCWSRLSFYAGLAPSKGLVFPADAAVIPVSHLPVDEQVLRKEVLWRQNQMLTKGWLPARTPTQFLTVRSRASGKGLTISSSPKGASRQVTNRLGTLVKQVLVREKDGTFHWAENIAPGGKAKAELIGRGDARNRLDGIFTESPLQTPPGAGGYESSRYSRYGGLNPRAFSVPGLPAATQRTGLLETALKKARSGALDPGQYVAVVERSAEVVIGIDSAREEASLHVILGSW